MSIDRRHALKLLAAGLSLPALSPFAQTPSAPARLSPADTAFLDDLERRGCMFFLDQASPATGQVLDRAKAFDPPGLRDPRRMASIASTGFGLTALCIAAQRGYISRARVLDRVRRTLRFHHDKMEDHHGFLVHFNDIETGFPYLGSEVSPIDTSIFLCGVLSARAFFRSDPEIQRLATALYHRVDWPWMLNGGDTFAMGYRIDRFIPSRWNHYCEHMMLYLLAIASPTHPIPASSWDAWSRPLVHFQDFTFIGADDPLFVHQYSHAWFDFRNKRDRYANYFDNSVTATRAHEAFCLSLGKPYSPDYWGITASDSQHGYTAWGGPPAHGRLDGSVVPCAPAGSLPFVPEDCLRVLRSLKQTYPRSWGRYGFCDAFHPDADWYDPDCLGIDIGIGVLMAENLRSNFVWNTFARNPEVSTALRLTGFHPA
ncbi:MAG TPA: glucoamylase family protein [Acidobacteriaceae bacterium]|nr:glucoamylase family protein [Acidobacteriaceae bacterium]